MVLGWLSILLEAAHLALWVVFFYYYFCHERRRRYEMTGLLGDILRLLPANVTVAFVDRDGTIVESPDQDLVGQQLTQHWRWDVEDQARIEGIIDNARRMTGRMQQQEIRNGTYHVIVRARASKRESVVVLVEDISEMARLKNQLVQSQRSDAMGRLVAGIAHDFNNILTSIIGYTELARFYGLKDIKAQNEECLEAVAADLEKVISAGRSGARVSAQLLSFNRDRDSTLSIGPVDLPEVVERIISLTKVGHEFINVSIDMPPDLPSLEMDIAQVEQIILNLVVNAYEVMPGGGDLHVRAEVATVTSAPPDDIIGGEQAAPGSYIRLSVRDSGPGIAAREQARIFSPFYTTKEHGTGLGLSIVRNIVEACGGFILLRSAVGSGSTFSVYLPIFNLEPPVSRVKRQASTLGVPRNGVALVIDDHEAVREFVARTVELKGMTVHMAADSKEATTIARELEQLDLLVADIMLPDRPGLEVAATVRTIHPEVYILYISGYIGPEIAKAVSRGRSSYLAKPFGRKELVAALGLEG